MRLGEKSYPRKGVTIKQRKFVRELIESGSPTEAASRVYNVKNRKNAAAVGQDALRKPLVQSYYQQALSAAGLTIDSIATRWTKALDYGEGIKATHKDYLVALKEVSKMQGMLDNKTSHVRLDLKQRLNDYDYDTLVKNSKNINVIEGEIVDRP